MDQQLCQSLVNAVTTIHDGSVSNQQRHLAQEFIDQFKSRGSVLCGEYGFFLFQSQQNDLVRFFGLQLVEQTIRDGWNTLSHEERVTVRGTLLQLIASGLQDIGVEKRFIHEKLASLVVSIVKREWPQRWPDLMDNLQQLCQIGDTQLELVLVVFRSLAEDAVDGGGGGQDMPPQRRREVTTALKAQLGDVLSFFYSFVGTRFEMFKGDPNSELHQRMVLTLLKTLSAYVSWSPVDTLISSDLHSVCCHLLAVRPFRMAACECLLLLLSRKAVMDDKIKLLFPFNHLDTILSSLSSLDYLHDDDDYLFLKRMSQLLSIVGNVFVVVYQVAAPATATTTSGDTVFQAISKTGQLSRFLDISLALLDHDSPTVASFAACFLDKLVRNDAIAKQEPIITVLPRLLTICMRRNLELPVLLDCDSPDGGSGVDFDTEKMLAATAQSAGAVTGYRHRAYLMARYVERDFLDSNDDRVAAVGLHKSRFKELARHCGFVSPTPSLKQCFEYFSEASQLETTTPPTPSPSPSSETISLGQESCALTPVAVVMHSVMRGVMTLSPFQLLDPSSAPDTSADSSGVNNERAAAEHRQAALTRNKERTHRCGGLVSPLKPTAKNVYFARQIDNMCGEGLKLLFAYEPKTAPQVRDFLTIVKCFTSYYQLHPSSLEVVVSKTLSFVTYLPPGETLESYNEVVVAARRKACTCLIDICKEMPERMLPALPGLVQTVLQLSKEERIMQGEKICLFEALVEVSNGMHNYEQQTVFLRDMSAQAEAEWSSSGVSAIIQSPESLIEFIGLRLEHQYDKDRLPSNAASMVPCNTAIKQEARNRLHGLLKTLHSIGERVKVPEDAAHVQAGGFGPFSLGSGATVNARHPFVPRLLAMLPNVLLLIETLHGLHTPEVRTAASRSTDLTLVLIPDESEVRQSLRSGSAFTPSLVTSDPLRPVRIWLQNMRMMAYNVVETACSHIGLEFYATPQLCESFLQHVFKGVDMMENRYLRLFLQHLVTPFICSCPQQLFAAMLDRVLPALSTLVNERLNKCWSDVQQRAIKGGASDGGDGGVVEEEVLDDLILALLTRQYYDFVARVFAFSSSQPGTTTTTIITSTSTTPLPFLYLAFNDDLARPRSVYGEV
eukprot:TRINITY_DN3750_c3_g1_i1.p1 TRINITY_DN3750_c3_g1~~TRINITY_DN3750_c3_g1_i1.p1  ORF type:complete len:1124 (-),score=301.77 TRINITY_DN3750_c3_g1_i1:588-3959(-)